MKIRNLNLSIRVGDIFSRFYEAVENIDEQNFYIPRRKNYSYFLCDLGS